MILFINLNNVYGDDSPIITLIGSDLSIYVGDPYIEYGATATDAEDGDLTNNIVIAGTVDTSLHGNYTKTYNVQDSWKQCNTSG